MMLERLVAVREHLKVLVVLDGWAESIQAPCAYRAKGLAVEAIILDAEFWTTVPSAIAIIRELDGETTLMPSLYRRMYEGRKILIKEAKAEYA